MPHQPTITGHELYLLERAGFLRRPLTSREPELEHWEPFFTDLLGSAEALLTGPFLPNSEPGPILKALGLTSPLQSRAFVLIWGTQGESEVALYPGSHEQAPEISHLGEPRNLGLADQAVIADPHLWIARHDGDVFAALWAVEMSTSRE